MKKVKKLGSMVVDRILNRQINYIELEKEKEWNIKLDIVVSWEEFWNLVNFLTSIWPNFSEKISQNLSRVENAFSTII